MSEGFEIGKQTWPDVEVPEADFDEYVRARAEDSHGAPLYGDLYLACALASGNAAALRAFDEMLAAVQDEEVRQLVRHKLLVAEPGKAPKIADYGGRGSLKTWLRIVATRTALDLGAAKGREVPVEEGTLEYVIGAGEDPELDYLKERYRKEFRAAFADAFAALDPRDRSLLRYAFGRGLSIDVIGTLYGVHRATAARWVVTAHEDLKKKLRQTMMTRLDVKPDEYASILRLIESRIEVSFDRLMNEGASKISKI
jgi:RNA polymerase sigma-70 factor (ECF subfamily)